MKIAPETQIDGYKVDHRRQYPKGTQVIVSNFTPRGSRRKLEKTVFFGLQYFIKEYLINQWNKNFFNQPIEKIVHRFTNRINNYLGPNNVGYQHIVDLHKLGYLPISIKALPEGSVYNLRVPSVVIHNTNENFFWLTNYLETIFSTTLWGPCTSATTAFEYKKLLSKFALETVGNTDFVQWQGHDFSFRGMFGFEASLMSGGAHLTSFTGTDTIPAIGWLEEYYNADATKELIGGSVAATEHSVACSTILNFIDKIRIENDGTIIEDELMNLADIEYVKYLITEVYPEGIVSIVADSFDYWNTITNTARILKDVILARNGKVVFRPDTGDPVKVVCGYKYKKVESLYYPTISYKDVERIIYNDDNEVYEYDSEKSSEAQTNLWKKSLTTLSEVKGSIECLWDIFGGTVTEKGYKLLDGHVGLIYGDSITLERAEKISQGLKDKGFASINIVYGIGSYTYQYVTRDTEQYAVKATFARVNGKDINIYKKPKTGDGMKNSAFGLTAVYKKDKDFYLKDNATWAELENCELKEVFRDGKLLIDQSLAEIRARINESL